MALGLLVEARGLFPLLRFGITPGARARAEHPRRAAERTRAGASRPSRSTFGPRICTTRQPASSPTSQQMKHGPEWERPGWVSFFENGRLVYSTGVGVRVHGGSSRAVAAPQGSACTSGGGTAPRRCPARSRSVRRMAIRCAGSSCTTTCASAATACAGTWSTRSPTTSRRRSGRLPRRRRPVRFLLNGEFQDVFVLAEHFDPRDYFVAHRGYPVSLNYDEFNQMWRQVRAMRPLRMASVGHLVDLDNLTRWFIARCSAPPTTRIRAPASSAIRCASRRSGSG